MTEFWRDGFWRNSVNGNQHWVEGHWVDREDWDRSRHSDNSQQEQFRSCLAQVGALRSVSARFVSPNAKCPVCDAWVFFFQNEFGSRVYFDELGPPWPKHPCTDFPQVRSDTDRSDQVEQIIPEARSDADVAFIDHWIAGAEIAPDDEFQAKYAQRPWTFAKMLRRLKGPGGVYLILQPLPTGECKKVFATCHSLPRWLTADFYVLFNGSRLAFFDCAAMEAGEVLMRRIRTAAAFVDEIAPNDDGNG